MLVDHFDEDAEGFSNDSETINWGMLQDDLGYILIDTMTAEVIGESDSYEQNLQILSNTLDEIFEYFQLVDGLVIDIRNNGGGNDSVSQAIVSRMIEQALPIYSKQARLAAGRTPLQHVIVQPQGSVRFTGPVALLISETTSSAAEIFALAMRERENTILIGEASGGGFSDILPKSLPHELNYTLSNEYYVSVDGEEFEGLGVPVDIEQPFFTLQQREEGVDPGLDSAIVWLNDQD